MKLKSLLFCDSRNYLAVRRNLAQGLLRESGQSGNNVDPRMWGLNNREVKIGPENERRPRQSWRAFAVKKPLDIIVHLYSRWDWALCASIHAHLFFTLHVEKYNPPIKSYLIGRLHDLERGNPTETDDVMHKKGIASFSGVGPI
jgi:hypothetical protein